MWNLSSPTRDWTHLPYITRQFLNQWTMREVPRRAFLNPGWALESPGKIYKHCCLGPKNWIRIHQGRVTTVVIFKALQWFTSSCPTSQQSLTYSFASMGSLSGSHVAVCLPTHPSLTSFAPRCSPKFLSHRHSGDSGSSWGLFIKQVVANCLWLLLFQPL